MTDLHDRLDHALNSFRIDPSNESSLPSADYAEEALARRFTARHRDDLKFVNTWGQWLVWNGTHWQRDDTMLVTDYIRTLVREVSEEISTSNGRASIARSVASAKTNSAIERLARADRIHASQTSDWDRDPWLLNTPSGTIDLRTGETRSHNQRDLITKITAVGPAGACPMWLEFLNRIFDGDQELIAYVKKMFGYSLTGSIQEQVLFFCYGTGGNGKGVLLGTMDSILADYSVVAPMTTFTATHSERHPTDLAMLRGARLVTSQETEDCHQWAESKIKALTGGDPISARFMRQDFFTFQPSFKLIIAGNQKPSLRHVDEAIRRRFNLIPFTVTIPAAERDRNLADKLKEEWPGILAWAVEGCLEWQLEGLNPPDVVVEATENYLADEDVIGRFIADRCERHPQAQVGMKELYEAFRDYCDETGETVLSEKAFSQKLEGQKLVKCKESRSRRVCFRGIRLRPYVEDVAVWSQTPAWKK